MDLLQQPQGLILMFYANQKTPEQGMYNNPCLWAPGADPNVECSPVTSVQGMYNSTCSRAPGVDPNVECSPITPVQGIITTHVQEPEGLTLMLCVYLSHLYKVCITNLCLWAPGVGP